MKIPNYIINPYVSLKLLIKKEFFLVESFEKDVQVNSNTYITLKLDDNSLKISFEPNIFINVIGPWNNYIKSISYFFENQNFDISLKSTDYEEDIKKETLASIYENLKGIFVGTKLSKKGYSFTDDNDLLETLKKIGKNFQSIDSNDSNEEIEVPEIYMNSLVIGSQLSISEINKALGFESSNYYKITESLMATCSDLKIVVSLGNIAISNADCNSFKNSLNTFRIFSNGINIYNYRKRKNKYKLVLTFYDLEIVKNGDSVICTLHKYEEHSGVKRFMEGLGEIVDAVTVIARYKKIAPMVPGDPYTFIRNESSRTTYYENIATTVTDELIEHFIAQGVKQSIGYLDNLCGS